MAEIKYQLIQANDDKHIAIIADWYLKEWNIPIATTIDKTRNLSGAYHEFQVLMMLDDEPIATGGLYQHVGILDNVPRLGVYKNWLALVYTKPDYRGQGLGTLICKYIAAHAKQLGLTEMHLFTHTAARLYQRLGWQQVERLALGGKDIVVMKKQLEESDLL
ncbi:GNAT family N-acetyltransferase [Pelobium manganitolerans]|uniref:GNAT family N-acetyltransferase n=1 Tax=Pelobium manganitolerans TaxID=1842495 RepID=UPI003FA3785F